MTQMYYLGACGDWRMDTHTWALLAFTISSDPPLGLTTAITFRCVTCGKEITEERPTREGDEKGGFRPETIFNLDGSPAVVAGV